MFWTDYTEIGGSLCLFGKVSNKRTNAYVSCFIKIDNILRKLFFLPESSEVVNGVDTGEEVGMKDVYGEVDDIMTKMNVGMHKIKPSYSANMPLSCRTFPRRPGTSNFLYPYTSKPSYPCSDSSADGAQSRKSRWAGLARPFLASSAPALPCSSSSCSGRTSWAHAGSRSRTPTSAHSTMPRTASLKSWWSTPTW